VQAGAVEHRGEKVEPRRRGVKPDDAALSTR
jgi:hypothetical protein